MKCHRLLPAILVSWSFCALTLADEGRTPIYEPTIITQPGTYVLTRDVVRPDGFDGFAQPLIQVNGGPVVLDLNGHAIRGNVQSDPYCLYLIFISGGPVTVRNGQLTDCIFGIAGTTSQLTIDNVRTVNLAHIGIGVTTPEIEVTSSYIWGGDISLHVSGETSGRIANSFFDGADPVISLPGFSHGHFENNRVSGRGGALTCVSLGDGNVIDGNTFKSCVQTSLSVGSDSVITRNAISSDGIVRLNGSLNRVEGNRLGSLWVTSNANFIGYNTIQKAFSGNVVTINGSVNVFEGNTLEGNACGLSFESGTGNIYRNNYLRGNLTSPTCGSVASQTDAGGNIN